MQSSHPRSPVDIRCQCGDADRCIGPVASRNRRRRWIDEAVAGDTSSRTALTQCECCGEIRGFVQQDNDQRRGHGHRMEGGVHFGSCGTHDDQLIGAGDVLESRGSATAVRMNDQHTAWSALRHALGLGGVAVD